MQNNSEVDFDRVVEWPQKQTTYLVHFKADPTLLNLQVEDKHSGDLWHSEFTSQGVEELTEKAKNRKKYTIFVRMLLEAFQGESSDLSAQILSYRQLSARFSKGGAPSRNATPEQASKRFLILTYRTKFEQMQFPLPLMHYSDPPAQRLRLIIKRMSHENQLLREGAQGNEVDRDVTLLRYQNESLKNKLKQQKTQNSTIMLGVSEEELKEKTQTIEALQKKCGELEDMLFEKEKKIKTDNQTIDQLQKLLEENQQGDENSHVVRKLQTKYERKLEDLIEDMTELEKELKHSREKEKKMELKNQTLQKQNEALIAAKHARTLQKLRYRSSSPESQKSERSLSVRSGRSRTSVKSGQKNNSQLMSKRTYGNTSNLKKSLTKSNRRPSVYDSDTESSKIRRMTNGRSSPYRQVISAVTANARKTVKPATSKDRSRSKSKERRTVQSPRNLRSEAESQMMMTEGYHSSSEDENSERYRERQNYMNTLRQKRNNSRVKKDSGKSSNLQSKLQNLELMIQRAAKSTKKRE